MIKRVIYSPKGRAAEYAGLAANLYDGCDHGCDYCFGPRVLYKGREEFKHSSTTPRGER